MLRKFAIALCCLALAACGDPLAKVPKLSGVDVAPESSVVEAVAAAQESDQEASALERLERKQEVGDTAEVQPEEAPAKKLTLWPFGKKQTPEAKALAENTPTAKPVEADIVEVEAPAIAAPVDGATEEMPAEAKPVVVAAAGVAPAGMFSWLKRKPNAANAATVQPAALKPEEGEVEAAPQPNEAAKPKRALRNKRRAVPKGADKQEVAFGAQVPLGQVARLCGQPRSKLGKVVAKYTQNGKYRLHDSAPHNTQPHTFYISGFDDGCVRQVSAATVVFGAASTHEQLRYVLSEKIRKYSKTDIAYEKLKSRVCGAWRKKPCGRAISKMDKDTVFVSVYTQFSGYGSWSQMLIHKGDLLAFDTLSN